MAAQDDKEHFFAVTDKLQKQKFTFLLVGMIFLVVGLTGLIGVGVYVLTDHYLSIDAPSVDLHCETNDACL